MRAIWRDGRDVKESVLLSTSLTGKKLNDANCSVDEHSNSQWLLLQSARQSLRVFWPFSELYLEEGSFKDLMSLRVKSCASGHPHLAHVKQR